MKALWILFLAAVTVATTLVAEEKVSEPWRLTVEERLALRFDAASMARRVTETERERREWPANVRAEVQPALGETQPMIHGRQAPELLLPIELFRSLVPLATDAGARRRISYTPAIRAAGWTEDQFWRILAVATAELVTLEGETLGIERKLAGLPPPERRTLEAEVEQMSIRQCRMRADALANVRIAFGAEAFDRFLYTAVAPNVGVSANFANPGERERLQFIEGGCR